MEEKEIKIEINNDNFFPSYQNNGIKGLYEVGDNVEIDQDTHEGKLTRTSDPREYLTITDLDYNQGFMPTQRILQTFTWLTKMIVENKVTPQTANQTIKLKQYMTDLDIKDYTYAKERLMNDLAAISRYVLHANFKDKRSKIPDFLNIRFIGTYGVKNGVIHISFDTGFLSIFTDEKRMFFIKHPKLLLSLNTNKYRLAFYLLNYFSTQHRINYNRSTEREITSIEILSNKIPTFPKKEKLRNRNFSQQIRTVFEKNMDALNEILTWNYCKATGEPLTDDELSHINHELFKKLYIEIYWREQPTGEPTQIPIPRKKKKK